MEQPIGSLLVLAALLAAALLASGCAQVRAQDLPDGRHVLTAAAKSGGYALSRQQARDDATEYCERSRQRALIEGYEDLPAAGLEAEHVSRVTFSCSAP